MECHYINLDRAIERRAALEANFARCGREGWELKRFSAIDETIVKKMNYLADAAGAKKLVF